MPVIEFRTEVQASAAEAFRWHARPGAFLRLSPPWERIDVLEARGGIEDRARLVMRIGSPPLAVRWVAVHMDYQEGRRFVDVQESGPFARWIHEHVFVDRSGGRSVVLDRVDYALPLGAAGELALGSLVRSRVERLFRYRGEITAGDLARHAQYVGDAALRIAITGASGMVGRQLAAFLMAGGHEVRRLIRGRTAREGEIAWNPAEGLIDHEALEGLDAVVHLAGESIAGGLFTDARKSEILASRVAGTRLLAEALSVLRAPPRVFLSASAVGYYGDRGEERVDENARPGSGFLAQVARAWEAATEPAKIAGIRTVKLRFGVIVSSRGGALAKMRPAFLLGAGGPIGTGRQGFSWIALDDAIYAIFHLIGHEEVRGAVNVVAPSPSSQGEFALALGRAVHRPAFLRLPAFAVRGLLGQLGEEVMLGGQFVEPACLRRSGFSWSAPSLADALNR